MRGTRFPVWLFGAALAGGACQRGEVTAPDSPETTPALQSTAAAPLAFRQVSAEFGRTCGTTLDNRAFCWGSNVQGRLGDGTTTRSLRPVAVAGGLQFRQVSEGGNHTCAVTIGDRAYCWGDNQFGQFGDGTNSVESHTPVAVAGGLSFKQVSAGGLQTCGVTTSNQAYCWGENQANELGIIGGSGTEQRTPALVKGGRQYKQITAGGEHQCALTIGSKAFCWGRNGSGQVGNGTTTDIQSTPVAVAGGLLFSSLSAGGDDYTCGITTGNRAYCWGLNLDGQLGDGTQHERTIPTKVIGGKQFGQLSAGQSHTCAVTPASIAYCWGDNAAGDLGNGNTLRRLQPTLVTGGHAFRAAEAGYNHSCAVTTDNLAYCWGANNFTGELGDGTLKNRLHPVAVIGPL
jgi:alpha-tubulin suppressor-like RCC1 family protein